MDVQVEERVKLTVTHLQNFEDIFLIVVMVQTVTAKKRWQLLLKLMNHRQTMTMEGSVK